MLQETDNDNIEHELPVFETREAGLIVDTELKKAEFQSISKTPHLNKKSVSERMKTNRFWLIRAVYYAFYSVWMIVMAIGIAIAWLIAMLFI